MCIDDIDFSILKAVSSSDASLWKKQVHRRLDDELDALPARKTVSVQTVGRRIDRLNDDGLLDPCIVTPEEINRDLIIAYETTEEGEEQLRMKRESILREYAADTILRPGEECDYRAETVAVMAGEELGLTETTLEWIREHSPCYLAALLCYHYMKERVQDILTDEDLDRFREVVTEDPALLDVMRGTAFRAELREATEDMEQSYLWEG